MLIEIPDGWIDFMKRMPDREGIEPGKPDLHMMHSDGITQWISQIIGTGISSVVILYVCGGIAKRAEELGLMTYDPETHTWKGVDYGEDQFLHADDTADLHAPGEAGDGGQGQAGVL